jgi:hypothetical protein
MTNWAKFIIVPVMVLFMMIAPAGAEIRCTGPEQVIRGHGTLHTPYCEDGYLAQVAREYGVKASAHEIRRNPSAKEKICRFIGDDIRVRSTCSQSFNSGGSRR